MSTRINLARYALVLLVFVISVANVSARTVYLDLLAANPQLADGSYDHPRNGSSLCLCVSVV